MPCTTAARDIYHARAGAQRSQPTERLNEPFHKRAIRHAFCQFTTSGMRVPVRSSLCVIFSAGLSEATLALGLRCACLTLLVDVGKLVAERTAFLASAPMRQRMRAVATAQPVARRFGGARRGSSRRRNPIILIYYVS